MLHNYVASWHDYHFKELFASIPSRTLISYIEFSKNYTLKVQYKIQSMHWHNDQVLTTSSSKKDAIMMILLFFINLRQ